MFTKPMRCIGYILIDNDKNDMRSRITLNGKPYFLISSLPGSNTRFLFLRSRNKKTYYSGTVDKEGADYRNSEITRKGITFASNARGDGRIGLFA